MDSGGQRMEGLGQGNSAHRISVPGTVISVAGENDEQLGNENTVKAGGGEG